MSKSTDISKAAAALGKRGGQAGTGKAKARDKAHYSAAGKKSGEVRRLRALTVAPCGASWAIFKTAACKEIWEAPFATEQLAKLRVEYWRQKEGLQ